jgi:dipeptidyl aminopeptidase/acylaminoacyl peptidase
MDSRMYKITALLLATPLTLHAAPLPTRADIFNSVIYSRPAISASGKWIASTAVSDGKLRVFPLAGGAPKNPGLPSGVRGNYYRWTSGTQDALIIVGRNDKGSVIYRFDAESGQLALLTGNDYRQTFAYGIPTNNYAFTYERYKKGDVEQDLSPQGDMVDFSPSGAHLPGYLAREGRYLHVAPGREWTFTAGGNAAARGTIKLLQQDLRHAGGLVSVSNDGRAWFLSSHGQDTMGLFSLDTASGERKSVAQAPADISKVILDPLTMAPDFVDIETMEPQRLILNPAVAPDLALLSANGNGFPTILDRSPTDRYWVVSYAHRDGTPRMVSFDRRTKKTAPLPPEVFTYVDSPDSRTRAFAFKAEDGMEITGHVSLPRAGVCEKARCPAVLMVHGGPSMRDFAAFNWNRFWLTSRGIAVIDVNFRGSAGFGARFTAMDERQWAGAIPKDVNAGLKHALAHFPIDGHRVAAMGTSFGGYLTLHLAATGTPLRCAVVDSASADIVKFGERQFSKYKEGSDILQRVGDTRNPADREAMTRMSASSNIDQLKSIPILHLHGDRDDITHQADSQQFTTDMLAANPRYTFVGMPDAGHGLFPGRDQYYALSEAFLGKCLGVAVQPITAQEAAPFSGYRILGDRSFMQP